jgi:uncharacterized repeat protein (TIGR03803 family)
MQCGKSLTFAAMIFSFFFGFPASPVSLFAADKEQVLYSFDFDNGSRPYAALIFDVAGNLYGTTAGGGDDGNGSGTVFQLKRGVGNTWTETVLHSFTSGAGGNYPTGGLAFDGAGNLYGTTQIGGAYGSACGGQGCGTVFQLVPGANGEWTEHVLHSFGGTNDGQAPFAGLIFDQAGHLYGTTLQGGAYGYGTVFRLARGKSGKWIEKVLHSFNQSDGNGPVGGVTLDSAGSLYGTTYYGGAHNYGAIFQLSDKSGKWVEKLLHSFNENDGAYPDAGLVFDGQGELYGTTHYGGTMGQGCEYGCGTVFQLARSKNGKWTETVLHRFNTSGKDGFWPFAGVTLDASGDLYGTTTQGGTHGYGMVFQLTVDENGKWTEKLFYSFMGDGDDGTNPYASVTFDSTGSLYGTTAWGGSNGGYGTAFEIIR